MRRKEEDFDMPHDDEHEPAEGDTGMHVAQKAVLFPDLDMQQAVGDNILDRDEYLVTEKMPEHLFPVAHGQVLDHGDQCHDQIGQDEYIAYHVGNHERVVGVNESFAHGVSCLRA